DHETRVQRFLTRAGVNLSQVEFFRVHTNRGWTRDFGPIFVRHQGAWSKVSIARFRFNGWARYPDWKKDDAVPVWIASKLGYTMFPVY
ncbi:MAG: agmatine deiminase family protein, partial [Deltaproteobacteria bacterium]|nr:agmatine deiminase family protein [Deltaproteobacteria bacterium]